MTRETIFRALFAVAMSPFVATAQLAATPAIMVPSGEVRASGSGSITVEPDLAIVSIQYTAAGKTPAIAGRLAARRANAIRAAVVALGIHRDSLPTTGRWGNWGNRSGIEVRNDNRDTSYVTNDAFMVRIHDLALVGRVIDTALTEGAQTISNVEFQATKTDGATIEAIKKATVMARAHAAAVAEASGLRLGRVLDVSVDGSSTVIASTMATNGEMGFRMADALRQTTTVAPELKVAVTVSGRWEMIMPR